MNIKIQKRINISLLLGLPILSNIVAFIIFAPLFAPGQMPTKADFKNASSLVAIAIFVIELISFLLVITFLKKEGLSLKSLFNLSRNKLLSYFKYFLMGLIPTLLAGWLYCQGQLQAGIETKLTSLSLFEIINWYIFAPIIAPLFEESIWRGYALPRMSDAIRGLILTSFSFAFFHGIFNPLVLVATFIQGLIWGWLRQKTDSIIPGMSLHFISRYLLLIPGFA